jgi:plasmid stabilization system protein ParE
MRWYRQRSAGLDRLFLEAFESALRVLHSNPEIAPEIEGEVRRYLLRGFPYGVFYMIRRDEVIVVACLHGALAPERWPSGGAA